MKTGVTISLIEDAKLNKYQYIVFCGLEIYEDILKSTKEVFEIEFLKSGKVEFFQDKVMISLELNNQEKIQKIKASFKNTQSRRLKTMGLLDFSLN